MLAKLKEVLKYQNPQVLLRYQIDYPNNLLLADEAFTELLKYLWLTQKFYNDRRSHPTDAALQFRCEIHSEMHEIDDMWHTFILFTKSYHEFCIKYYGHYLHHYPNMLEHKPNVQEFETTFTRYLSYIYDNLGEKTVQKWFAELVLDPM